MVLEGVVTNVAAFGAFVDVGVHQDGLVHISAMTNTFVKDPRAVVKSGDVVRVKVLEVDPKRRRISLTMRLAEAAPTGPSTTRTTTLGDRPDRGPRHVTLRPPKERSPASSASDGALADALRRAGLARDRKTNADDRRNRRR
jgi:uncharacterized protein